MKPTIKTTIFLVALLGAVFVSVLVPTPNVTNGGAAKMVLIIVVAIVLKVLLEWTWRKLFEK